MCKAMENLKEAMAGDLHLNARRSIKGKFGTDGVAFSQAALSEFHLLKAIAKQGFGRNGL